MIRYADLIYARGIKAKSARKWILCGTGSYWLERIQSWAKVKDLFGDFLHGYEAEKQYLPSRKDRFDYCVESVVKSQE